MSQRELGAPVGLCIALLVAEAMRRRNLSSLARLHEPGSDEERDGEPDDRESGHETIDVVVPARDEAGTIAGCVTALRRCRSVARVIVVDDGSTDGTTELATAVGAEAIRLTGLPAGWMGKPHACAAGAAVASAPWLAFVDADVVLHPAALASLVEHCRRTGAPAASPLLRQRCTRAGDRLVVPLAWWQYLVGLPGAGHLLNGQCSVVSGAAYRTSGGHGHPSVRGSVVEDVALGALLAGTAGRPALVRAEWAGEVRMYSGLRQVRAGFGKNLAGFLAGGPARGVLVAGAGIALSAPLPLLLRGLQRSPKAAGAALVPWAVAGLLLRPRYADAGASPLLAAAAPLGAGLLQGIALESLFRQALGRPHRWRGRPARPAR